MFGLYFHAICPSCGQKHLVSLGACTAYYEVNNYEFEYTDYICPLCNKSYWLAHNSNNIIDTKKRNKSDKANMTEVICW